MTYKPTYIKPYPDGWENLPSEKTPIKAEVLDAIDNALISMETQLEKTTSAFDETGAILLHNFSVDEEGNCEVSGDLKVKGTSIAGQSTVIFDSHDAMRTVLNSAEQNAYKEGQTIRIRDSMQSDLWVSQINETQQEYVYGGDLEGDITAGNGSVQIGFFSISLVKGKNAGSSGGEEAGGKIWRPTVSESGDLSWETSDVQDPPETVNIKGPKGDPGGAYTEADKAELTAYIDTKFAELTGDILGGAS